MASLYLETKNLNAPELLTLLENDKIIEVLGKTSLAVTQKGILVDLNTGQTSEKLKKVLIYDVTLLDHITMD
jgi:hypothetical protein